jgi:hypothetical protein
VKREAEEDWGVGKIMWDIHIGTHSICPVTKTPLAASEQAREGYQQAPPRSSTILGGAWPMGTKNCVVNISGFLRRKADRPRHCLKPSLRPLAHLSL